MCRYPALRLFWPVRRCTVLATPLHWIVRGPCYLRLLKAPLVSGMFCSRKALYDAVSESMNFQPVGPADAVTGTQMTADSKAGAADQEAWSTIEPPASIIPLDRTSVRAGTTESDDTAFFDASAETPGITSPLRLGQPIEPHQPDATIPLPLRSPKSPRRAEHIEVNSGIGVPSMRGSLGYFPSVTSVPLASTDELGLAGGPSDHHASTGSFGADAAMSMHSRDVSGGSGSPGRRGWSRHPAMEDWKQALVNTEPGKEDVKGKGKEGSKRIWDEAAGKWVELRGRIGSGRTKVDLA